MSNGARAEHVLKEIFALADAFGAESRPDEIKLQVDFFGSDRLDEKVDSRTSKSAGKYFIGKSRPRFGPALKTTSPTLLGSLSAPIRCRASTNSPGRRDNSDPSAQPCARCVEEVRAEPPMAACVGGDLRESTYAQERSEGRRETKERLGTQKTSVRRRRTDERRINEVRKKGRKEVQYGSKKRRTPPARDITPTRWLSAASFPLSQRVVAGRADRLGIRMRGG
jgi:hypothetical protein